MPITSAELRAQEALFGRAFAEKNLELVRPLYHPDVVYLSPTVRLFEWPARIEGIERTLEFITLTIQGLQAIRYEPVEHAVVTGGESAFVRVHFDWSRQGSRLRSNYVVVYRYRERRIGQQELYYDPSGALERIC